MDDGELARVLARIEQRQAAYEVVAHRLIGILDVHNQKLDAILEAATVEPEPSPTTEILQQILTTMRQQTALLEGLPAAISETIRDEMQQELDEVEMEPAEGAFDAADEGAPQPVLTFRKGPGGAPTAAAAMAEHLREQTIPEEMVAMADYYLRGVKRAEVAGTAAIPRQDMPMAVAVALGLDVTRTATHEEVVNLLQGRRADGEEIGGRQAYKVGAGRDRITYVDFTFSAPKSVSVAMALAPTDAERHMIVGAHRDAWMSAMAHLETIIARARKDKAGSKGSVPGRLGWVSFDHDTARPTIEIRIPRRTGPRRR